MRRFWEAGRKAACITLVATVCASATFAQAPQFGTTETKKSWNPFKKDTNKLPSMAAPPLDPNDPTSLANKKKPDAGFYASWGELEERGGRNAKALELFQRALKEDRRNLTALLGAARMKDAANAHDEALNYYRQALRAHPNEAPVYNDLGLSHAKAKQYPQAIQAFQRAVQIDGERKLYRNNLANVMIDAGQIDQALFQLQQAHGEALGHFNLGCLLAQKQRGAEASECFARAEQLDPSLAVAPDWQERLAMRPRPAPQPPELAAPTPAAPSEIAADEGLVEPQPAFDAPMGVQAPVVDAPSVAPGQEAVASDAPLLDFGQPGPVETIEGDVTAEGALPEAPLSEPILPDSEVTLAPTDTAPSVGSVYESPRFAEQDSEQTAPMGPVVRAAPGSESWDPPAAESQSSEGVANDRPLTSSARNDGRPALPPRPSAVQLYRQHAAHSDQAPTPEAMFPPYDGGVEVYPGGQGNEGVTHQHSPHVGRRPANAQQPPQKRSARGFKNPFSGLFGAPKKR